MYCPCFFVFMGKCGGQAAKIVCAVQKRVSSVGLNKWSARFLKYAFTLEAY